MAIIEKKNILFTLCGRAGSKGFRNKNLKVFCGAPLVYYSIAAIKEFVDKNTDKYNVYVVVNSDSKELIELVKKQKFVEIDVINREEHLAGDAVPKEAVIKDCYIRMVEKYNTDFSTVVDLDITSPLRTVYDIERAINKKLERTDTDVVYSVTDSRRNPYFNMVKEENGYFEKAIPSEFTARQQAPAFYDMNASIYAYSSTALKNKDSAVFFNDRCDAIVMKDTGILDIDSEEDFNLMQVIAQYLFISDQGMRSISDTAKAMCD